MTTSKQPSVGSPAEAAKLLSGYNHIVDDGEVSGHGFFLPKQDAEGRKSIGNCGVNVDADVPNEELDQVLIELGRRQKDRLAQAGIRV